MFSSYLRLNLIFTEKNNSIGLLWWPSSLVRYSTAHFAKSLFLSRETRRRSTKSQTLKSNWDLMWNVDPSDFEENPGIIR